MVEYLTLALASWRLAYMLVYEDGPFEVFETLRFKLSQQDAGIGYQLHKLFSCVYCMSVWSAGAILLVQQITPVPVLILALSGGVILLHKIFSFDA